MSEPRTPCKHPSRPLVSPGFPHPESPSGAAARTTLAAVAAMALAFTLHLEVPALAVVFVLARGSAGALTMISGAVGGAAVGIVLLDLFDQSRVVFSVLLVALATVGTYGALGRHFAYGWVQALLSLLILVGQSLDDPDTAVRHAFYDLADVVVAAVCAFVAGVASPAAVPARLQDALAARLGGLARQVARGHAAPNADVLTLERAGARTRMLLAGSWPTRLASRARLRALAVAEDLVDRINDEVLVLLARARLTRSPATSRVGGELPDALDGVAALVAATRGPIDDDRPILRAHARTVARDLHRASRAVVAASGGSGRQVSRLAARLALLSPFLLPGTRTLPRFASATSPRRPRPALDTYRLRHAVKSAVSYLLVLWAWLAADWGAIVPALVVSVLVATLATPVGATLRKAALRVAGVLVGGVTGLLVAVLLLPLITELPTICVVAGVILFGFQWVQQHRERLAFASLQAAIAFVLTLVHGAAPSPTWRAPLESLIGLAFGIVVVVVIMHAAWPIDAATSAHATLADLLELAGRRLERLLGGERRRSAASRRDHAAARAAREHAVGFLHEIEMYGTQFGRPAEDLARLARPIIELDALVRLLESAADSTARRPAPSAGLAATPHDAPDVVRRAHGAAVNDDCRALAAQVRAFPGEPPALEAHALRSSRQLANAGGPEDVATSSVRGATDALIDALLRDVVRALANEPEPAGRRAA